MYFCCPMNSKTQNSGRNIALNVLIYFVLCLLFWILWFDIQRIIFSIHNLSKFTQVGFGVWLGSFIHSFRLDLATASYLSFLPLFFFAISLIYRQKWARISAFICLWIELCLCAFIHAGEVNAYPEWNHKLTGRVFMHLAHPDEVVRTADWTMTFLFVLYVLIELIGAYYLLKVFFKKKNKTENKTKIKPLPQLMYGMVSIPLLMGILFLFARGGLQPIPINTDAAIYTTNYVANDLSINSTYFFAKSFMLYRRTNIDEYMPQIAQEDKTQIEEMLFNYPQEHENFIFNTQRPNFVFIILESWTANAIGSLTQTESATPHFDKLSEEGLFFTNIYGVSGTSEIGNAAILSGYPGIPEISITMQADKHRKIPSLNQHLKQWGYKSGYLFSGDLKYGNIGGYLSDHGFDFVEDEKTFPKTLKKGKLNYYDQDLYSLLVKKINKLPEPFFQCAFTGSTHSPYDYPNPEKHQLFGGVEGNFLNSLHYADSCLAVFINEAKKQSWYKNTVFVLVADHGHASNIQQNPSESAYNRIPLLFFGQPLKNEYRGKKITVVGSQLDISRTILYQLGGDYRAYRWAKDLLNPQAPAYALHTINRGYGWVTPQGNFTYHMVDKRFIDNSYNPTDLNKQLFICRSLLAMIYEEYKLL